VESSGRIKDSLIADPLFENVQERDFRLKKGSPAEKIGSRPLILQCPEYREVPSGLL
jgi:hypothetical protein